MRLETAIDDTLRLKSTLYWHGSSKALHAVSPVKNLASSIWPFAPSRALLSSTNVAGLDDQAPILKVLWCVRTTFLSKLPYVPRHLPHMSVGVQREKYIEQTIVCPTSLKFQYCTRSRHQGRDLYVQMSWEHAERYYPTLQCCQPFYRNHIEWASQQTSSQV